MTTLRIAAITLVMVSAVSPIVHNPLHQRQYDDFILGASWLSSHIAHNLISAVVRTPYRRADELETYIQAIRGGDKAAALRRLESGLNKLRVASKEVDGLVQGAEEAAAKLQVR